MAVAAAGVGTFKPVEVPAIAGEGACPVDIRIEDAEGCPAFYGRVIRGVANGTSPDWMQRRLLAAGQRPISALVALRNRPCCSMVRDDLPTLISASARASAACAS